MCNNLWLQKMYTCILITWLLMCISWEDIRPILPHNTNVSALEGSSLLACNAVLLDVQFPTFCRVVIPSSPCSSSQYINTVILWSAINYLYSDVASHHRILLGQPWGWRHCDWLQYKELLTQWHCHNPEYLTFQQHICEKNTRHPGQHKYCT